MKNGKKRGLIVVWISIFVLFTFLVFFVIGCNSKTLVNDIFRWIALSLTLLSVLALTYGIYLMVKFKRRNVFKKVKIWIFSILVGLYAVGCTTFLIILYGPYTGFKNWLITTAMATMNHQYYCKWFYSDEEVKKVMGDNFIDDGGASTDASLIDHKQVTDYKDDYEREILEHNEGENYKLINFEVNGCKAYLAAIYDPSMISVGVSKKIGTYGEYADSIAKRYGSSLTINGGGFKDLNHNSSGGNPVGVTISQGKVYTSERHRSSVYGIIGFDKNDTLILSHNVDADAAVKAGIRDCVTMGPFLIVNGKASFVKGNGGWGYAARTAIGQRKDGVVLFLVVDSNEYRTKGASMVDLAEIMQRYGAVNAANLDGGTSSIMAVNGEFINDPIDSAHRHKTRPIPTVFNVIEK